jgi:hypothetical protein
MFTSRSPVISFEYVPANPDHGEPGYYTAFTETPMALAVVVGPSVLDPEQWTFDLEYLGAPGTRPVSLTFDSAFEACAAAVKFISIAGPN